MVHLTCLPSPLYRCEVLRIWPRQVKEAFDHPDYLFDLRHDGFRAVVYIENGDCKFVSRNMKLLRRFEFLKESLSKLPVRNAIIDGEIVCLVR